MARTLNDRQSSLVSFVARNPGATKMDAVRSEGYGLRSASDKRRGHAGSYSAIDRLVKRGFLRVENRSAASAIVVPH
jgi:hypothetical protein